MEKNALSLLSIYESDNSDEEDPICGPPKRKCEETNLDRKRKKLPLPPLSFDVQENHVDNPLLHDGRIRSFEHERGNWATFVYIPYEPDTGVKCLVNRLKNELTSIQLKESEMYHISLTKTVILKYHWIEPFVYSIKTQVHPFRRFLLLFDSLKVYCNEERTRTFIGLQIKTGYDSMLSIIRTLDKCLQEFNLEPFYKNPSFHMSIAWCVGDFEAELNQSLDHLNKIFYSTLEEYDQEPWHILVDHLICKTGNKFFQFSLT